MEVIVGTAGHIDHGKTALVKALTGTDADRLPEEKRRGITVDLGFAEMRVGDVHIGFVDVPGHEGFVKNMLAGASGIDLVLLVVAATEGVMPQTREHFDICRLLGVTTGIIVLTKSDIADAESLEIANLDVEELVAGTFMESAPVVTVSSKTGEGIGTLKETIRQAAARLAGRNDKTLMRLPIDRSFSMKGFGAVVTGTLASGKIVEGAELKLLPVGRAVRVRGIQTHGETVMSAAAGRRVAVNLAGIDHASVTRGMVLIEPNILQPTQIFDAEVEMLRNAPKPLRSRQRVRVHIGTSETLARVQVLNAAGAIPSGSTDLVQVRLEESVAAIAGERFIIRQYSPQTTIGGGSVIDTFTKRPRRAEIEGVRRYLARRLDATGDDSKQVRLVVEAAGPAGLSLAELQSRTALRKEFLAAAIDGNLGQTIIEASGRYILRETFEGLAESAKAAIEAFHKDEPLSRGISRAALTERVFAYLPHEIFQAVIGHLESVGRITFDKDLIRLRSFQTNLSAAEVQVREKILAKYKLAGLEVPKLESVLGEAVAGTEYSDRDARRLFQLFLDSGEIVKVTDDFYFAKEVLDILTERLRQFAARTADRMIDMPAFKEMAGISRKYAIPLLEYFDRERITARRGDKRFVI